MKQLLILLFIALSLTSDAQNTQERVTVTTSALSRSLLTNESAAGWLATLSLGTNSYTNLAQLSSSNQFSGPNNFTGPFYLGGTNITSLLAPSGISSNGGSGINNTFSNAVMPVSSQFIIPYVPGGQYAMQVQAFGATLFRNVSGGQQMALGPTTSELDDPLGASRFVMSSTGAQLIGGRYSGDGSGLTNLPSGSGSVTSAGLTAPNTVFSVANSPITTSGNIALTFLTQPSNTIFAGAISGSAALPTFRPMVAADIPANLAPTFNGINVSNLNASAITNGVLNNQTLSGSTLLTNAIVTIVNTNLLPGLGTISGTINQHFLTNSGTGFANIHPGYLLNMTNLVGGNDQYTVLWVSNSSVLYLMTSLTKNYTGSNWLYWPDYIDVKEGTPHDALLVGGDGGMFMLGNQITNSAVFAIGGNTNWWVFNDEVSQSGLGACLAIRFPGLSQTFAEPIHIWGTSNSFSFDVLPSGLVSIGYGVTNLNVPGGAIPFLVPVGLSNSLVVQGAATFNGGLNATGNVLTVSNVTITAHLAGTNGAPNLLLNTNGSGVGAALTADAGASDTAETLTLTTGTGTGANVSLFTNQFANAYTVIPHVIFSPNNGNAAFEMTNCFVTNITTTNFQFWPGTAAFSASKVYSFTFHTIQ